MKESYPLLDEDIIEEIRKENQENNKINNLIRKGFIVKVYSLLFILLILTFSFVFLSMEIKSYVLISVCLELLNIY